ncbi:hypothetical protein HC660_37290 [Bacillus mojavensis]|jgi:hypothetical protein|uniref:Uncharacterized protein n=1 Tax=Bacillus mojavensis TaxID=72360 RepID=A0ABX6M225_BACMO|nr:hypothetical protein HC660_37290 [Bacillus mojavensis]
MAFLLIILLKNKHKGTPIGMYRKSDLFFRIIKGMKKAGNVKFRRGGIKRAKVFQLFAFKTSPNAAYAKLPFFLKSGFMLASPLYDNACAKR